MSNDDLLDSKKYLTAGRQMGKSSLSAKDFELFKELLGIEQTKTASVLTDEKQLDASIKAAEEKISKYYDEVKKYEKLKEELKNLPFKLGDVAYHTEYGNVIVKGIELDKTLQSFVGYMIVCTKGEFRVASDLLLPLNETTKVLYGK